ncbi:MAG: hypothetical protein PHT54_03495 [Candidatus Nanoarchaeia archaeon]|nr:hypothetical protein [Candidatus Nanoarchaeia archaeon]
MIEKEFTQTEHDLLIELKVQVQNIRNDIKELSEGTTERIVCLEKEKADRKELEEVQNKLNKDHEIRIRKLESSKLTYYTLMSVYTGIGVFIISLVIYHMLGK